MSILTGYEAQKAMELNFLVKTYEGLNKLIVGTKQRLRSLNSETDPKNDSILGGENDAKGLESVKGTCSRRIANHLKNYPIWTEWAANVPGCGPAIAGTLVCEWTYKMRPICADCSGLLERENGGLVCESCGKKAKGDGVLRHRVEIRDYPNISKWWAKLGRHVVDGKMPKRAKGQVANWSTRGRTITKQLGECFVKLSPSKCLYRAYYDERKAYRETTHPDASKGHRHNMAMNETIKLFLSHWWQVARTQEGKPLTDPYAIQIMNHTGVIPPYYWPNKQ
jgi:hypothetical protein